MDACLASIIQQLTIGYTLNSLFTLFSYIAISSVYVETKFCEVACTRVSELKDVGYGEFQFLVLHSMHYCVLHY